ncbi:uncharacterized protein [Narcine bancroftii]|uniref:uncharacterized protein n=1 Tax=Narcine bancroftii TaxID=1343680 RepID=UPI0038310415
MFLSWHQPSLHIDLDLLVVPMKIKFREELIFQLGILYYSFQSSTLSSTISVPKLQRLPVGAEKKKSITHQVKDSAGITCSLEESACSQEVDPDSGSLPILTEGARRKTMPLSETLQEVFQPEDLDFLPDFLKKLRAAGGDQRQPPEEVGVPSLGVQTRSKTVKMPVVELQQELQLPGSATTLEKAGNGKSPTSFEMGYPSLEPLG